MEIASTAAVIIIFFYISARIFSAKLMSKVTYNCYFSTDEAFENEEIEFTEEISNNKILPVPWIKTEFSVPKWLEFPHKQSTITADNRLVTSFFSIRGMCRIRRVWKVKCVKRGHFSIESIHMVASDVLGHALVSSSPDLNNIKNISVRVLPLAEDNHSQINDVSILNGDTLLKNKLIKDEFFKEGIREYVPGDKISSINWYATARERSLMVNKYDCTSCCTLTIIMNMQTTALDISESSNHDKLEACIKTCAGIIGYGTSRGMTVRYISNTMINDVAVDLSASDPIPLLEILADTGTAVSKAFPVFLSMMLPFVRDSYTVVVTPYYDEEITRILSEDASVSLIIPEAFQGGNI